MNFQHGLWTIVSTILIACTLLSCNQNSANRVPKNWSTEVTHEFPNTNWAFEEEVLEFPFEIKDTSRNYDISVVLLYDTAVATLKDILLALTLSAPDGMKSLSTSHFLLDLNENPDIMMVNGYAEATVLVYPARKFKVPGTQNLTVYRRAPKADNYGFLSLTTKVKVVKK